MSPCLFGFYAQYVMRNSGLDESQAGIKISGRNINNLRYADDTILMAESKQELKSFLIRVEKKSEKAGLKLNIQNSKDYGTHSHYFMANSWENVETLSDFIFLGFKINADGDCSHEIKRCLLLGRKTMTNLDSVLKSRRHFANKGPSSQGYGFSSSHVQM